MTLYNSMMPSPLDNLIDKLRSCKDTNICMPKDVANKINDVADLWNLMSYFSPIVHMMNDE